MIDLAAPDFCVPGGFAARNRGADYVEYLAPIARAGREQASGLLPPDVLAGQHRDYVSNEIKE